MDAVQDDVGVGESEATATSLQLQLKLRAHTPFRAEPHFTWLTLTAWCASLVVVALLTVADDDEHVKKNNYLQVLK